MQVADRIRRVNGQVVNTLDDAQRGIYGARVGDRLTLGIERGGKQFELSLTLIEAPAAGQ